MHHEPCALIRALRSPRSLRSLAPVAWDLLVRQARSADLLANLWALVEEGGFSEAVPEGPRVHLESGYLTARKQVRDVRWEVRCIRETLSKTGVPIILLKGAAYVMADLPVGRCRVFGDIDILVPKESIAVVERTLLSSLWVHTGNDPYDQHYYRTWMHQIPPLMHLQRESVIDVHHSIVPETARFQVSAELLRAEARALPGFDDLKVLAPPHMVLHSAAHLFNEGEFEHALRDLVDLDGLLRHFGADPGFWPRLLESAEALDLARPLHYALRYTGHLLGTPVPEHVTEAAAARGPGRPLVPIMDALFERALPPLHSTCSGAGAAFARWLLYVRAHYLRMPLRLLVPHLVRKALVSLVDRWRS